MGAVRFDWDSYLSQGARTAGDVKKSIRIVVYIQSIGNRISTCVREGVL